MASLFESDKILHTNVATVQDNTVNINRFTSNMSPDKYIEKRYDDIIKSPNDKRVYRGIMLTNKMKVLLISEPSTYKSAAALNVNIGYLNDPDDLPGLAHFCEHMLFLGTEKYPEKNEYNKYLLQNGGTYNASTCKDHTLYYFDVCAEKLLGALDRFAQFFIAPLFTEALTELELNAVHSEYEKNLAKDTWRIEQVEKSSADPNHPFSKFDGGNKETLDTIPKQNGVNTRERLLEFHKNFYSSNIMSLCVLGKESLDELEKMVVDLFSPIKNKEIAMSVWPEHPFNEQHFQTKWYIVPVKDTRNVNIIFPMPDLREYYKSEPERYVSHLLGHEGEGSLLSSLRAKGWCNSLIAGNRPGGRGFNFFNIIVDLTEKGTQHIDDIILLTFQYINMLKKHGPVEWIHNECRDIANMNFRFREKVVPRDYVTYIAPKLCDYPVEEVLKIGELFEMWKPDLIEWILEYLKPENVRIQIIGKAYESIANETEKWYGTKFKKEKIPKDVINKWVNAGVDPDLKLPPKNEFIPEKFDMKPIENVTKFPVIVEDTPLLRLWFKQDDEFLVPKANLCIDFASPLAYMDPLSYNLTYMFVLLFRDTLNEYAYDASIAGLKWNLSSIKGGISLVISGYDNKQHVLLNKIIDKMVNFKLDLKRFEIWKENHIRSLKNFEAEQPYQHAMYYLSVLLSENAWTKDELLKATSHLTVEKMHQFIPQFLSKVYMECMIHGNVTKSEAIEIGKLIESKLVNTLPEIIALLPRQLVLMREVKLDQGCCYLFEVKNKYHNSSCTQVYYQVGSQATESNMLLELLVQILSEPCFTTLRTKEQLGYIVFTGVRKSDGTQGLRVIVQSERHPAYVEQRINIFLDSMIESISSMPEEEFEVHKESLAMIRFEKPNSLAALSNEFWGEICSQQYNFDRANIEATYLKTIKKEQIIKFYRDILDSNKQQKLSIHVLSTTKDEKLENELITESNESTQSSYMKDRLKQKKIEDILSFKISHCLYPLLKPFNDIPRKGARSSKL